MRARKALLNDGLKSTRSAAGNRIFSLVGLCRRMSLVIYGYCVYCVSERVYVEKIWVGSA